MTHETPDINQELIVIKPESRLDVFTKEGGIEPFIKLVRDQVKDFVGDVTTEDGRSEIKSLAAKIGRSKTYLEKVGKELADEQKKIPKLIDAARGKAWDQLEALQKQIRRPVTEYETVEKARVEKHAERIGALSSYIIHEAASAEALRLELANIEKIEVNTEACEEFADEYRHAKGAALEKISAAIMRRDIYESEQAELAKLRKLQAEQVEKERAAAASAEAIHLAQEAADKRVRDAEAETARVTQEAEREANRRIEEARKADQEREDEIAREKAAQDKREASKRHCGAINRKAMAALVDGGISEDIAKVVVTMIAQGKVPSVAISY